MLRRVLIGAATAAAVYALTVALAASLGGVSPANLGADGAAVASCDTDGVSVDYSINFDSGVYKVATVTVSGIADACDGQSLDLTLADVNDTVLVSESASIPVDGTSTSLDVSLSTLPAASAVENVDVAIS